MNKKKKKAKKKAKKSIGQLNLLVCSNCKKEFFMIVNDRGTDVCLGCYNTKGRKNK